MSTIKVSFILLAIFFTKFARSSEDSLYDFLWLDPDKSVYVLQHKVYEKKKSFFVDVSYLSNGSSEFQKSSGFSGSLGYFFMEDWGVELGYSTYSNTDNAAYLNVTQINGTEPFVRRAKSLMNVNLVWSPFYGKINTFNKIIYFDLSFGAGLGKVDMESNIESVIDAGSLTEYSAENYTAIILKSDLKVYINRRFHIQVGIQDSVYSAPGPRDVNVNILRHNIDMFVGVGFSF